MLEIGVVVAIIIALGQFAKMYIDNKYVPLVTLVIGLVAGYFYLPHVDVREAIVNGVMVALTANGMFDMSKIVTKKAE
jgi:hypothetical protein